MSNRPIAAALWACVLAVSLLSSDRATADSPPAPTTASADVCVYGGSGAAVTAARQAALMGRKVLIVSPEKHLGGMNVEGLGSSDLDNHGFKNSVAVGGLAKEFYQRLAKKYGRSGMARRFEPHVAEEVMNDLADHQNVRIFLGQRISEKHGTVKKSDGRIQAITTEDGSVFSARVFIDATIEGDLLHFAGVSTVIGREANAKYGETKNGIRGRNTYRQFSVKVDPYVVPGDSSSGVIPTIQDEPLGTPGAGDDSVMGYCFRMCLTRDPQNRIPFKKPQGYDRGQYEIYLRYLKAGGRLFAPSPRLPGGKTDLGSWHDLSANLYGMNHEYPGGDYATRQQVYRQHLTFTQGLCYFLANDPEVPERTRARWRDWGVCKDEFQDNGGWPRRMYVRSARRMVSDYVITEHHTKRHDPTPVAAPVGVAYWPPDMHHARRIIRDGVAYNEGFVFGGNDWGPFGISYRSLVPKREECTNLLTPTCPSSSYVAYGAIRLEWTFLVLGQSAGAAAALVAERDVAVQDLPYEVLKERLRDDGQVLEVTARWPAPNVKPPEKTKPVQQGASGTTYSQLPPGAKVLRFEKGAQRCADRFELTAVPSPLSGLDLLVVPRGAGLDHPGAAYRFSLDHPARIYLLVMDRGAHELPDWKKTGHAVKWVSNGKTFSDSVYVREFPAGKVQILAHTWRDKDGAYGIPHAVIIKRMKKE